jgi:hypothetical protein
MHKFQKKIITFIFLPIYVLRNKFVCEKKKVLQFYYLMLASKWSDVGYKPKAD